MAKASAAGLVTMLVIPVAVSTETNPASRTAMENGCWAKLYGRDNYEGDSFTLVGPIDLASMQGPFGVDWSKVSSIQAGPKASLTLYDNVNFRDRAAKVDAGRSVPQLDEKLGFFENVNSMRINCPAASTG
jgi:hypothetical protein